MLSIPPYILLIPFGVFFLGFVFFAMTNIVCLAKYGARNGVGFLVTFAFIAGSALILFAAWQALAQADWTAPVPLLDTRALTL